MKIEKFQSNLESLAKKLDNSEINYAFYLFEKGENPIFGTKLNIEQIVTIFESLVSNLSEQEFDAIITLLIGLRDIRFSKADNKTD